MVKTALQIGLGIVLAVTLVVVGLGAGWVFWGRQVWSEGPVCGAATGPAVSGRWSGPIGMGRGMMRRGTVGGGCSAVAPSEVAPCGATAGCGPVAGSPAVSGQALTIDQAAEAVEQYVAGLGDANLELDELMEFEYNFYAIVKEADTGIGALELLVDKATGAVGPEMGPNMMWNARYGMMRGRGMMGSVASETNTLTPEEALEIAQRWLDVNRAGAQTESHADPFYGYYTVHTLRDGAVEGMLSVHGDTGQVWYHTWHGDFVQMVGEEE